MSKIQFLAFETSGLKPEECRILEVGIATLDTKTDTVDAESFLLDPGNADMSDEIIELHRKSGLLGELIEAGSKGKLAHWPDILAANAHVRICWAKDFIAPFFAHGKAQIHMGGIVHGSISFDVLRSLAASIYDLEVPKPAHSRVAAKLEIMLATVRAMRAGAS